MSETSVREAAERLAVGQRLFFSHSEERDRGHDGWVTVEAVGRKWARISNGCRIDIETLVADGGEYISPGCCWRSKEEYDEAQARTELWRQFRDKVSNIWRYTGSTQSIREAAAALNLPLTDPSALSHSTQVQK